VAGTYSSRTTPAAFVATTSFRSPAFSRTSRSNMACPIDSAELKGVQSGLAWKTASA